MTMARPDATPGRQRAPDRLWRPALGVSGRCLRLFATALALTAASVAGAGATEQKPGIAFELNSAQAEGAGCRLSFVFRNGLDVRVQELAIEVVLFDDKDNVVEFLIMKTGTLPPAKARVRQFELKSRACTAISKLLVNDVKDCQGEGLSPEACLDALRPTSTATIGLEM